MQQTIARLAQATVKGYFQNPHLPDDKIDFLAEPLLQELRAQGIITEEAFVEWQGVYEFRVIPVFYFEGDNEHVLNVNTDGTIDHF